MSTSSSYYIILPPPRHWAEVTGSARAAPSSPSTTAQSLWPPSDVTATVLSSDAGLQLAVEQGGIVGLQVGVVHGVDDHPAPVRPAVAALDLVHARHPFQTQDFLKALLEVVRQEGVQDGVGAAVGVAQDHHEVEGALHGRGGADGAGDGGDVENVERQPAEHEHRHHDGHHPGHLTLGALALGGAHSHAGRLHLVKRTDCQWLEITRTQAKCPNS